MKASVAVNAVPLAPGGGLTFLVNQARQLAEAAPEWEFTYFGSPRNAGPLGEVVPAERLVIPFRTHPGYLERVRWEQIRLPQLLRAGDFDLVYLPANYAVFRSPVPQVVVDHNPLHHAARRQLQSLPLWVRARLMRLLARATARRAESIVYLSHAFSDDMGRVGFSSPDRVVPSGVSLDWGAGPARIPEPFDCAKCLAEGFALALHNWYPHKRLAWLTETWRTEGELSNRHLVVVGSGWEEAAMAGSRIGEVVHVMGGSLSRSEIAGLFTRATVFLSASVLEAFPLTPFEAMSFEVPCVLSDIASHREVAGDAAVYFEPESVEGFVRAVATAIECSSDLVDRGRRQLGRFSWTKNAEEMLDEFERVLGRTGKDAEK